MKQTSITSKVQRTEFLKAILQRLDNDVRPYFACIEEMKTKEGKIVGFWALARMILPVIEATAEGLKINKMHLLKQLGIKYPNITWLMFRHSLMHGDLLRKQ